jgi:hypothetical protein
MSGAVPPLSYVSLWHDTQFKKEARGQLLYRSSFALVERCIPFCCTAIFLMQSLRFCIPDWFCWILRHEIIRNCSTGTQSFGSANGTSSEQRKFQFYFCLEIFRPHFFPDTSNL